ncbi:MAG: hypothetical protein SCJ94_10550 [Bacillota bacterium]|nr:hypothetical protein [Bacillota bacterium]
MLPVVGHNQIIDALKKFDRDYRNSDEWIGWETKLSQKYAIKFGGKLYPPKMVISLATDLPRSEFSGGQQSNNYLSHYGLEVIKFSGHDDKQDIRTVRIAGKAIKDDQKTDGKLIDESCSGDRDMVREVYKLLKRLPRFNFYSDMRQMPDNGIYFFFEVGEYTIDGYNRLVRIGTHRSDGRLKKRLMQHYKGNRNSSVFRKHLGGAIINRDCPDEVRLGKWFNKNEPAPNGIENRVSDILEQNFYYSCLDFKNKKERLSLEEGLIALFAGDMLEKASTDWLGNYAVSENIKSSSLWNSEHTAGNRLTNEQFGHLCELVEESSYRYPIAKEPKALVLIPCCKRKADVISNHWLPPFPNLQQARAELLEKIELTEDLYNK